MAHCFHIPSNALSGKYNARVKVKKADGTLIACVSANFSF
jgi:hypothetical protein